jgi:hypothetical protein
METELRPDDAEARKCGLDLLDASRAGENLTLRPSGGLFRPRTLDRLEMTILGLAGRERRFLAPGYVLADSIEQAGNRRESEVR